MAARSYPGGTLRLNDCLTDAQARAMRTNVWTGVDITAFTAAVQEAIDDAQGRELVVPTPAFIKVNRPLVWTEITTIRGMGTPHSSLGVIFYPDLSVDWPTLYPDQGVLTADKYLYGYSGHASITAGFWTGIGKNFQVRANMDSALFASNPERVPDYGIVLWSPNESCLFEHVQVLRFRKHNWLCGGVSAVPTFVHCNGSHAGQSQNTILGDAVTRPASAFGASVYVYWNVNASTSLHLEAAASTDLDTLASGDVLRINGSNYTVTGAPPATATISDRTVIGGVVTTTRYRRLVVLTASLTANGRIHHAGIAFRNHPNLTFASGVSAALGGRGNSGSARIFGFSGDSNQSLISLDGAQALSIVSPKSESNNCLVEISGSGIGGGRAHVEIHGYRADGFGTFDAGLVRITGISRPSVVLGTGQIVSYTNILNDETPSSGAEQITTASFYGQGFLYYCKDNSEVPSFTKLRTNDLTTERAQIGLEAADPVGFYGASPATQQTVTGSKGGNAALTSLLSKLATLGLIVDSTT
jgi:hypothetical protein